ncbi:beta-ketoacyl synthase N-terminal-like domain-containing protein [Aquimarina sp. W85]|uniref:type I polyketide synthase n=1 Tax=Aquimarina rhodophyticola TaxID=3342246 RepID=UPI00366F4D55
MKKTNSIKDIAIVGMSGKFAQSEDIETFWEHLIKGQELVRFYDPKELQELGIADELIKNPNYVFANSLINNPENFDYNFFGYTKAEAEIMDPQIRLMHEYVWLALEDAGCNPENYVDKIGLYLAASDNINWRAHTLMNPNEEVSDFMATRLANKSFISTLISYNLNLKGPSLYLDTACSSSLTSIHLACRSLLMKECSIALAGASSILTTKGLGYMYDEGMVFSEDGHCRTFDKESTGTFFGEGVGVLALKRLGDAIENNDHIYAVIKATAVNNDGNRKVGYTAPSIIGQAECIKLAQRIAGLQPEDIGYVEAHGTGTKLGDPVEIEALNKAFNYNTKHRCAIGSVKSNLGHLDAVAGIVGVIKTAMALKNKMLPPSINYHNPNPDIDFQSGPFYVNTKLKKINNKEGELFRAGVSSFGIGGTNAHIILEEFPINDSISKREKEANLLLVSAKTNTALSNNIKKLCNYIRNKDTVCLQNLTNTLQLGRKHFNHRCFLVVNTKEEAIDKLETMIDRPSFHNFYKKKKTVFMFSGGGSQYYRMAYQLYLKEPIFKEIMDHGFELIMKYTQKDIRYVLGYLEKEDVSESVNDIENMLPILFIVEYALARLLMSLGIQPDYMIGHSLGEYIAACISEVFTFEDALKIVIKRGELTAKLPEGAMVGIEISENQVKPYLTERLSIATINMEDSCVISGAKNDIQEFIKILEKESINYTELKISIAAHSTLLDEILDEYRAVIDTIKLSPPKIPFISNLSGEEVKANEVTSSEYWVKHLRHTVNFLKGISWILNKVTANYIEIGSGGILTSFLKQNKFFQKDNYGINILRHPKEQHDDHEYYLKVIGKLWQKGVEIDWGKFNDKKSLNKISIPGYAFDKTKIRVKVNPFKQITSDSGFVNNRSANLATSFHIKNWKKTLLQSKEEFKDDLKYFMVFVEETPLINRLLEVLDEKIKLIKVYKGDEYRESQNVFTINPFDKNQYERLFAALDDENVEISQVIYAWDFYDNEDVFKLCIPVMHLSQALIVNQSISFKKATFLGSLGKNVLGSEQPNISFHLAEKTMRVVIKNNSNAHVCSLDVDTYIISEKRDDSIVNDILYNYCDCDIAYRNEKRWLSFYERVSIATDGNLKRLGDNKNYLIINGLGKKGIGLLEYLSNTYQANIIVTDHFKEEAIAEETKIKFDKLKNNQKNIQYYTLDPSESEETKELVSSIEENFGEVSGIIYLSKENEISDLSDLNNLIDLQIRKIRPVQNLYELFKNKVLDFIWIPTRLSSEVNRLNENIYFDTYANLLYEMNSDKLDYWISVAFDDVHKESDSSTIISELFELSVNNKLDETVVSFENIENIGNKEKEWSDFDDEDENGMSKIDDELQYNYVAPETSLETELCGSWQTLLGFERIGVEDSFFELGGNSLKAMTLLKRIQKQYGVQISLKDFFAKSTVKLLSEEIDIAVLLRKKQTRKETKILKI